MTERVLILAAWNRNIHPVRLAAPLCGSFASNHCYQIILEAAPDVQRTLIVRWLPPDPNDRSRFIEPEPD